METTVKKVTEGKAQELSSSSDIMCTKYKQEIKFELISYYPILSDDLEQTVIKNENDDGLVANLNESKDQIVEINSVSHNNHVSTVMLEKILKTEAEIVGDDHMDDEPPSCSDEDNDLYNIIDTGSDSDSNPDPELDPFADINCDPSFLHKPNKSHNSDNSAPNSETDGSNSFEKSILPPSDTNTLKQEQLVMSRLQKKLNSKLQCGLCLEKHSSESKLQTHVKICVTCHRNRHRFCVPCNTLFCLRRKYRDHAIKRHGIQVAKASNSNSFKCQFCPRFFDLRESLVAHLASHPEIKNFDKERLHLKPYECQDCSSTFSHYSALSSHMKSHKDERDFKCPIPNCERAFKLNGNLKEHLKRMHSDSELKPFKCEEANCGKTFKMADQLRKHMVCHSEDRPFPCSLPDCGKFFKNKEQLKKHLKAHAGARRCSRTTECERPFKCQECDRAFCKNWRLTAHLKTHVKKEMELFKCPQPNCKATFKYKENIKKHVANIHTNKEALRFQCPSGL